jgi:histidinol-phosphatase (PHP family)
MTTVTSQMQKFIETYKEQNRARNHASPVLMDYHVHDFRSRDAPNARIADYIVEAETRGIKEIAFTNHLILSGHDTGTSIKLHEIDSYLEDIWRAQEDTEVSLKTGFEVDYIPDKERLIESTLNEYPLDFVLGSVHEVEGLNIAVKESSRRFFYARKIPEAIDKYYRTWQMAIESEIFDVMSHPDYFRKTVNHEIRWEDYGTAVYDAIESMKNYGVGFEINTSGYRHGIGDKFPRDEFIMKAINAGVDTITLGSDSHMTHTLGYQIRNAVEILDAFGLKAVSIFNARTEEKVPIEKVLDYSKPE